MKKGPAVFILLFLCITLFLLPNFYRNKWNAVENDYYAEWQTRYDRLVVARLVKTRMDGFFSAGGLMGLGNTDTWGFTTALHRTQLNTYLDRGEFASYLVYKSNPGIQGLVYGAFDRVSPFTGQQNLKILRGFTALSSAIVFGLILTGITLEFGLLSGLLSVLFTAFSMWIVLPAGSIFWDLWAFFVPFVASAYLLAEAAWRNEYNSTKIYSLLFIAILIKILFSGFDLTTTVLVMATVPFIFHALLQKWEWKMFTVRFIRAGAALMAGTAAGLMILSLQIITNEGSIRSAYDYVLNRLGSHAAGNYEYFTSQEVAVRPIHISEVLPKYLLMPALDISIQGKNIPVLYWHLIIIFALFTLIPFLIYRNGKNRVELPRKVFALMVATWYSLLAPLSWLVLFRPHSFIHTHVNTMGWQMPFTILGFTLCGVVIQEFFLYLRGHQIKSAFNTS